MIPADNLRRILEGYSGQGDDALRQELADPHTDLARMLGAVRMVAAAPLDLRRLGDIDDILAFEATRGDSADWHIDRNDAAPGLRRLANLAAHRVRDERRVDAIDVLVRVARLALVHLGEGHRDTPTYINALARLYYQAGDYETAGHGFERAIELRAAIMGSGHTDTAISLTGLARVREAKGRYREAVELHCRALDIFEATLGAGHPDTGVNLNDLGCALHATGQLNEAKLLFERALAISLEFDGPNEPNTAIMLCNLGGVLQSQGELEQAKRLYIDAWHILRPVKEANRDTFRWAVGNFASVLAMFGLSGWARDEFNEALAIQFGDSPDERLAEATVRNNLGYTFHLLGDRDAANAEFHMALDRVGPMIPHTHPLAHAIRINRARCGIMATPSAEIAVIEWAAFQNALGTTNPLVALSGQAGVWNVPWGGRSFPVILALAA